MTNSVESIFTLFSRAAIEFSDKNAFVYFKDDKWQNISFAEFYNKVIHIAHYLQQKGAVEGSKVAICAENMPEWCAAYLAIMAVRAIAVPMDPELGVEEIKRILISSGASIAFASSYTMDRVKDGALGLTNNVDVISFASIEFRDIWEGSQKLLVRWRDIPPLSTEETASIIFTSGTTGQPKGVMLTHLNIISDGKAFLDSGIINRSDSMICVLPLYHTYAFTVNFFISITYGLTFNFPIALKGRELLRSIKETRTTVLVAVPRIFEMLLHEIDNKIDALPFPQRMIALGLKIVSGNIRKRIGLNIGKKFFSSIHDEFGSQFRFSFSGGAKLMPEYIKRFDAYGFTISEGYGLSETSPIVSFNPLEKRKIGSVGKPIIGALIRIAAPVNGRDDGEVLVKGPMVFKGYYGANEQPGLLVDEEGWLHTGDIGYMDEDGYLYITGRLKDVIVLSSGKNVYPEDVELKYSSIPIIKEICVLSKNSKTLHAIIAADLEKAGVLQITDIEEYMKQQINVVSHKLPQYMRISGFTLISEPLPKTRLGKLKRYSISKLGI